MRRRRNIFFWIIAFAALAIAASAVLLYQNEKTFFPEKLGDMELNLHREGDVAIREIKVLIQQRIMSIREKPI